MKIFFIILFFFTSKVFANEVNLTCVTETPTTSFIARTSNGVVEFNFIHHHGVKYMPIHEGVITPNDLNLLAQRANILSELGDQLTFTMPSEFCQTDGMLLHCFGSQPKIKMAGHEVNIWAAYSTLSVEESLSSGKWEYLTTNLAIEIDGQSLFLPMKYYSSDCSSNSLKKFK